MEELLTLKDLLLSGDVPAALAIVEELEEMSRKDIIKAKQGHYEPEELEQLVNREDILDRAMALILPQQ